MFPQLFVTEVLHNVKCITYSVPSGLEELPSVGYNSALLSGISNSAHFSLHFLVKNVKKLYIWKPIVHPEVEEAASCQSMILALKK